MKLQKRAFALALAALMFAALIPALPHIPEAKASGPATLYVAPGGAELPADATSWASATSDLQGAIEAAVAAGGGEVYVQAGTYAPATQANDTGETDDRYRHFSLRNGVRVVGGFAGTEGDGTPTGGATILSGDLLGDDVPLASTTNKTDNAYHVFYHPSGLDATAALENVTISGGSADGASPLDYGGGMFNDNSSPTLVGCTFTGNTGGDGGGMYNSNSSPALTRCAFVKNPANYGGGMYNNNSNPAVTDCTFTENSAKTDGGGMYNKNSNPTVIGCTFTHNSATDSGGGMYNYDRSSPTVTDCTFTLNSSSKYGGGMYNYDRSSPTITGCTFTQNSATQNGGGMSNDNGSTPTVIGCTFTQNLATQNGGGMDNYDSSSPTLSHTIICGNTAGATSSNDVVNGSASSPTYELCIVGADICDAANAFAPTGVAASAIVNADGTLPSGSPAIDAGDDAAYAARWTAGSPSVWDRAKVALGFAPSAAFDLAQLEDIAGNPRLAGASVDIGAYEYIAQSSAQPGPSPSGGSSGPDIDSVSATPIPGGARLAADASGSAVGQRFQWQARQPDGSWADIPGATGPTFDYAGLAPGQTYAVRCVITSGGGFATSPTVTFTAGGAVTPGGPAGSETFAGVGRTTANLNVRPGPNTRQRPLGVIPSGGEVTILSYVFAPGYSYGFYQIAWNNAEGFAYVAADYVDALFDPPLAATLLGRVYVQSRMSASAGFRLAVLEAGDAVTVTGRYKQWWIVQWNGVTAYIRNGKNLSFPLAA